MQVSSLVWPWGAVVACLLLAGAPSWAGRPEWMPKAPALPVTGRVVNVATVAGLQAAVAGAQDGDTIMVADGVYQLSHFLQLTGRTGVTLRGTSGDAAKVELRGLGWDDTDRDDILRIQACSDITVAYLTFAECHAYGVKLELVAQQERRLSHIRIYACSFRNIGMRAIKGTGGGGGFNDGGSIQYCNFENTKVPPKTWLYNGDYITAIDCMRLKDWVISDNWFHDLKGANGGARGAIFVWVESENVISERNVFVDCDRAIAYGNPSGSTENSAHPHNTGGIIRNNFIVMGADTGIEICWARDVKVYHNTVLTKDDAGLAIHYHWQELSGIEIRSNLVRGQITGDAGDIALSDNVAKGVTAEWFRNAATGDLHLASAAHVAKAPRVDGCQQDFDGKARAGKTEVGAATR